MAVYHVNRVRFPAGALAAKVLPPWRSWFARLSEKQEDLVRFQETALFFTVLWVALREQLGLQIRAAGFNSLATCHFALVAQLEEHRFRKPGVAGSNPAGGTRSTKGFCCRGREVRHLSATQDNAGPSPAGSFFMGPYFSGRMLGLHPSDPGSNPGGSTSLSLWFRSSVG